MSDALKPGSGLKVSAGAFVPSSAIAQGPAEGRSGGSVLRSGPSTSSLAAGLHAPAFVPGAPAATPAASSGGTAQGVAGGGAGAGAATPDAYVAPLSTGGFGGGPGSGPGAGGLGGGGVGTPGAPPPPAFAYGGGPSPTAPFPSPTRGYGDGVGGGRGGEGPRAPHPFHPSAGQLGGGYGGGSGGGLGHDPLGRPGPQGGAMGYHLPPPHGPYGGGPQGFGPPGGFGFPSGGLGGGGGRGGHGGAAGGGGGAPGPGPGPAARGGGGAQPALPPRQLYGPAAPPPPASAPASSAFAPDALRQRLHAERRAREATYVPTTAGAHRDPFLLPDAVGACSDLFPLEELSSATQGVPSEAFGMRTLVVRATRAGDGAALVLRRLDPAAVPPTADAAAAARAAAAAWAPLADHPTILVPRGAVVGGGTGVGGQGVGVGGPGVGGGGGGGGTASASGAPGRLPGGAAAPGAAPPPPLPTLPPALWVASTYVPGASTLRAYARRHPPPHERAARRFLARLAAAVKAAHDAGLAIRAECLHPTKVLIDSEGAPRIGGVGIRDALDGDVPGPEECRSRRLGDLRALGRATLAFALGPRGAQAAAAAEAAAEPGRPAKRAAERAALELLLQRFSSGLVQVVAGLLGAGGAGGLPDARALCAALSDSAADALDAALVRGDSLRAELAKEIENGRALRTLAMLGSVAGRPGPPGSDPSWAETGDRYLLKLFQTQLLHQRDEQGRPCNDWGHILEGLNKLEAGSSERLLLQSPDGSSFLVVTYSDLHRCLRQTFDDLFFPAVPARR